MRFTSLNHFIDVHWLREAYRRTRKDGVVGVGGQTAADYEANLEENLRTLLERAKSGTYFAPPVRRVHIPKTGSQTEMRPIGIPMFEDKVLQRAVVMVLEAIYEQDFCDCSYGFRPGRSAHDALNALWQQTMQNGGGWILGVCPTNEKRVHERVLSCSKTRYSMPKVPSECRPSNENCITRTGS
ncbi:MAG: reverse transcriptase domain-containing protein [Phycisphaerae bacterium]